MSNYSDSTYTEGAENSSWYKVLLSIPEESKVLDIGCSSGNFGKVLIDKKACIVDGVELDKSDFKKAQKNLRKVYNLNIETDSIAAIKDTYDVIYFGDVIEHLVDPVTALQKVKKLLNKNGKIVFSIPNMAHSTIRILMLKGDFEYTETGLLDKTHLHFYNLKEVQRVFAEAGYDVTDLDFVKKDYPDALIKKQLAEHGLKLAPKSTFLESLHQPDAAAFQFVGSAKPSAKVKRTKLKQFGPIDMFESFHMDTVNGLQSEIERLQSENTVLKAEADRWLKIRATPAFKAARKIKQVLKK